MKKQLFLLVALVMATSASAQFYVSASGGYAIGSAGIMMGKIETDTSEEAVYGSYGEGLNGQIRVGYFFNDTFGVDFGLGYLHGSDQTLRDIKLPSQGQELSVIGRGRAFGAMPALVYKFNEKLYGRIGAVLKVGGKTEVVGEANAFLPAGAVAGVPANSNLEVEFTRDFKGELPLGFTAALGYKHKLNDTFSLFIEAEYLGISVRRDEATLEDFNATLNIEGVGAKTLTNNELIATIQASSALAGNANIQTLAVLISDKTDYVDKRNKTDNSVLAETVPYSSFGINFGITYTFGKK